jgi:hypothetical protein
MSFPFRSDLAAERRRAHSVAQRPGPPGDAERPLERRLQRRVAPERVQNRDERGGRQPVERGQPRAVDETHARERDPIRAEQAHHGLRPRGRRASRRLEEAQLLEQDLPR